MSGLASHVARVRAHLAAWKVLDAEVATLLEHGAGPPWVPPGPVSYEMPEPYVLPESQYSAILVEIGEGVRCGAWRRLSVLHPPFLSGFSVPKKNHRLRLICDATPANDQCIPAEPFSLPTLQLVAARLARGWVATIGDVSDAFYHIPLLPSARAWFRCAWKFADGRELCVEYDALPMGWRHSPRILTHVFRRLPQRLEEVAGRGCVAVGYVDDFLVAGERDVLAPRLGLLRNAFERLGLALSPKANFGSARSVFTYLGLGLDLEEGVFFVPQDKLATAQGVIHRLLGLARKGRVPLRLIASVAGVWQSLSLALPAVRHHLASLYHHLGRPAGSVLDPADPSFYHRRVFLTKQARRDCRALLQVDSMHTRRYLWPNPTWLLSTDASESGWGAVLAPIDQPSQWMPAFGFWDGGREVPLHINQLELAAIFLALDAFAPDLLGPDGVADAQLHLRTDSTVSLFVLRKLCSRVPAFMAMLRDNFAKWDAANVTTITHVASAANPADSWSRLRPDIHDFTLAAVDVARIEFLFGPLVLELFCSGPANQALPGRPFCALPSVCPASRRCLGDARDLDWSAASLSLSGTLYGNPPYCEEVWPWVACKLRKLAPRAVVVLVLPLWQADVALVRLQGLARSSIRLRGRFHGPGRGPLMPAPSWETAAFRFTGRVAA